MAFTIACLRRLLYNSGSWEAWLSALLGPRGARPLYKCLHCRKHPGNTDILWSREKEGLEKKNSK